jgi:type IV secretory pathway VirB2 component (pilin)
MNVEAPSREDSNSGRFHPLVFKAILGLAAWFVLSAWIFAGAGVTDFLLVIVSAFISVAVGLPALLAMTRHALRRREGSDKDDRFGDWAAHEVQTLTGPVKGIVAAIETILPIAAVAFGMTIFGLVLHFAAR